MMFSKWLAVPTLCALLASASLAAADDAVRNYGSTYVEPAPSAVYTVPPPALVAEQSAVIAGSSAAPAVVAFGHRRRCCGGGAAYSYGGFPAYYGAYGTYQPNVYASGYYGVGNFYGAGYNGISNYNVGAYGVGYRGGNYWPPTPNPYGYYQNGQIWGSSRPTYARPFPVWDSPSGIYDYRYRGWGSYGWGGWGGTGPAGWGYQGGFYW